MSLFVLEEEVDPSLGHQGSEAEKNESHQEIDETRDQPSSSYCHKLYKINNIVYSLSFMQLYLFQDA